MISGQGMIGSNIIASDSTKSSVKGKEGDNEVEEGQKEGAQKEGAVVMSDAEKKAKSDAKKKKNANYKKNKLKNKNKNKELELLNDSPVGCVTTDFTMQVSLNPSLRV